MHAVNLLARVGLFSHSPSVTGIYRLPTARDQIFLIFNRLCNPLQGDWQQKLDQLLKKKREMSYLAAADQSRRIFRGRGGPTDRRLPKQNAARRQPQRTNEEMELYQQQQRESRKTNIESNGNHRQQRHEEHKHNDFANDNDTISEPNATKLSEAECSQNDDDQNIAYHEEVHHLLRRIQNNRSTMSTSSSLTNLPTYQTNVLAACQNTVREWKSIRKRYHELLDCSPNENFTTPSSSNVGTLVFELIQQSVQVGPLAGAKPGYFKRCGSEAAAIVYQYLQDILEEKVKEDTNKEEATAIIQKNLGWTCKQVAAVTLWKRNAQKAAAAVIANSKISVQSG
jgi:hypothetical protein